MDDHGVIAAANSKKSKVEQEESSEPKPQCIALKHLNRMHQRQRHFYIQVKCVQRFNVLPPRHIGGKDISATFKCVLQDKAGTLMIFEAWGVSAYEFGKYIFKDMYYELSNLTLKECKSKYDEDLAPGMIFKIDGQGEKKKDGDVSHCTVIDEIELPDASGFVERKLEFANSIKDLEDMMRKHWDANKSMVGTKPLELKVNVVGKVLEHGPIKTFPSKTRGKDDVVVSKVVIGDESKHAIQFAIWGKQQNEAQRYKNGQLLMIEGAKLGYADQKNNNLELKWVEANLIDEEQYKKDASVRNSQLGRFVSWALHSVSDVAQFRNLSNLVPYNSQGDLNCDKVTARQLLDWQKKALVTIKQWEDAQLVQLDENGRKKLTEDQVKELPNGKFSLVGEITHVTDINLDMNEGKTADGKTSFLR